MKTKKAKAKEKVLKKIEELKNVVEYIKNSKDFIKEKPPLQNTGSVQRTKYTNEEKGIEIKTSELVLDSSIKKTPSVYYIQMKINDIVLEFAFDEHEIHEPTNGFSDEFLKKINEIQKEKVKVNYLDHSV